MIGHIKKGAAPHLNNGYLHAIHGHMPFMIWRYWPPI